MFKKILIANRGEIAVRIMATCREMGIATVAVYSEVDRHAKHVREADEAYELGPAPATQSYLYMEKLLTIASQSGAEAIHPGYGFLSENTAFVAACEAADFVFIGPPAAAMRLMGSKIAAKQLAMQVNAPVIPGYNGASQDEETLLREAQHIGFPLLIKASAGGGGKGMREVHAELLFLDELAGARREAQAAFGDSTVFLEKLLLHPRHIEIQVLGDRFGHLIHLGERECSIQRRHQKILEESPSLALTPALRAEMGAAAVRIATAAGYINAGTLEFMLDTDQRFYFLEMNTRLQVEHPVTELVTGLDLVRQQILIAAGEPLALEQTDISPRGHAIEVRLYAENPALDFLPSTGTLVHFHQPAGPGIRVDSGVTSGDEITQFYDPLLAKLIVYGENRLTAIARLQQTLNATAALGVTTNLSLLQAIVAHPAYSAGQTYTSFLTDHELLAPRTVDASHLTIALQAAGIYELMTPGPAGQSIAPARYANPWQTLGAWRNGRVGHSSSYTHNGQRHYVTVNPLVNASWQVRVDEHADEILTCTPVEDHLLLLGYGHRQERVWIAKQPDALLVCIRGDVLRMERQQPPDVDRAAQTGNYEVTQHVLTAPMAGTIVKVQVSDGDEVEQRQVLVILTAMKMEHAIIAPQKGKIKRVHYREGDVVKGGSVLVEME